MPKNRSSDKFLKLIEKNKAIVKKDPSKVEELLQPIIEKIKLYSKEDVNKELMFDYYMALADFCYFADVMEGALEAFKYAEKHIKTSDQRFNLLFEKGIVYKYDEQNEQAMKCFEEAYEITDNLMDKLRALDWKSKVHLAQDDYKAVLKSSDKFFFLAESRDFEIPVFLSDSIMGDLFIAYWQLGNINKALEIYKKLISSKSTIPETFYRIYRENGHRLSTEGRFAEAREEYKKMLKYVEDKEERKEVERWISLCGEKLTGTNTQ